MLLTLEFLEKLAALTGSLWLALPFFRDQRLALLLEATTAARPADEGAAIARSWAHARLLRRRTRIKPRDLRDGLAGIGLLGLAFVLGIVGVLIKWFSGSSG